MHAATGAALDAQASRRGIGQVAGGLRRWFLLQSRSHPDSSPAPQTGHVNAEKLQPISSAHANYFSVCGEHRCSLCLAIARTVWARRHRLSKCSRPWRLLDGRNSDASYCRYLPRMHWLLDFRTPSASMDLSGRLCGGIASFDTELGTGPKSFDQAKANSCQEMPWHRFCLVVLHIKVPYFKG